MLKKISFCVKPVMLAVLILTAVSAVSLADVSYIFPCRYRYEVDDSGNVRTDSARLGAFNNIRWRTWAEFDISALQGSTVTGVGFRVYNEWQGSQITSLRYSRYRPSLFVYPGSILNMQTVSANLYNGFLWNIGTGGKWTPADNGAELFFRPSPEKWDTWKRQNGNSVIRDIQDHIDNGKLWFTVGFGYLGWPCPNLRLPDNYDPASVYMEVVTDDILIVLVPEKAEKGARTAPMSCSPVNFATGNKYIKETDLVLHGPGLPLIYARHYNSQSSHNGYLGRG